MHTHTRYKLSVQRRKLVILIPVAAASTVYIGVAAP